MALQRIPRYRGTVTIRAYLIVSQCKGATVSNLPPGDWRLAVGGRDSETDCWIIARDSASGDEVGAHVCIGDLQGEDPAKWELPAEHPTELVWCFQRLTPRHDAKRSGGSGTVIDRLCRLADECGVWLIADVLAEDFEKNEVVIGILERRGFASHSAFRGRMRRAPRALPEEPCVE